MGKNVSIGLQNHKSRNIQSIFIYEFSSRPNKSHFEVSLSQKPCSPVLLDHMVFSSNNTWWPTCQKMRYTKFHEILLNGLKLFFSHSYSTFSKCCFLESDWVLSRYKPKCTASYHSSTTGSVMYL